MSEVEIPLSVCTARDDIIVIISYYRFIKRSVQILYVEMLTMVFEYFTSSSDNFLGNDIRVLNTIVGNLNVK